MLKNSERSLKLERWEYIDLIECIGIFMVIIYHSTTYSFDWLNESNPLFYLRYYLRTILSTCVPLFFFANGYLLLNRKFDLKKHIMKSVRIVILTLVWGVINILCLMLMGNEILSLKEILVYLFSWHQGWINHLWYMGALICIYIFLPVLKNAFDTNRKYFIYFTIITAILTFGNSFINIFGTLAMQPIKEIDSVYNSNWFNIFNPFRGIYGYAFVYFCVGGLAYDFKDKVVHISKLKRNLAACTLLVFSCFGLFVVGMNLSRISGEVWDVVWNGYDTIFTFINVISIFVISLSYNKKYSLIRYISCNTLGIYFIHGIFMHGLKGYVQRISAFCTFSGCIIFAAVVLAICFATVSLMKRIPIFKPFFVI